MLERTGTIAHRDLLVLLRGGQCLYGLKGGAEIAAVRGRIILGNLRIQQLQWSKVCPLQGWHCWPLHAGGTRGRPQLGLAVATLQLLALCATTAQEATWMATLVTLRKAQRDHHVNLALATATMDSVPTMARGQVATRTHLQLNSTCSFSIWWELCRHE